MEPGDRRHTSTRQRRLLPEPVHRVDRQVCRYYCQRHCRPDLLLEPTVGLAQLASCTARRNSSDQPVQISCPKDCLHRVELGHYGCRRQWQRLVFLAGIGNLPSGGRSERIRLGHVHQPSNRCHQQLERHRRKREQRSLLLLDPTLRHVNLGLRRNRRNRHVDPSNPRCVNRMDGKPH